MDLIEARDYHLRELQRIHGHAADHPTLRQYGLYERRHLAYLDDNHLDPRLDMLNPHIVSGCQLWIREHHGYGIRGGRTAEVAYARIMKIWSAFLFKRHIIPADLLVGYELPRLAKVRRRPFTEHEAQALMAAASTGASPLRDRAIMVVLSDTGGRVGELCGLHLEDVLAPDGSLRKSIAFRKTKGGIPRDVVVQQQSRKTGGVTLKLLADWIDMRSTINKSVRTNKLWLSVHGNPLNRESLRRVLQRICFDAGIDGNRPPHAFRRASFTERYLESPNSIRVLASRMGWSDKSHHMIDVYTRGAAVELARTTPVPSVSARWHAGTPSRGPVLPASRQRPPAVTDTVQTLLAAVKTDPKLRQALLRALLNDRRAAS